jgi:glucosylceramidase
MKVILPNLIIFFLIVFLMSSCTKSNKLEVEIIETSASGNKLTQLTEFRLRVKKVEISILPN